MLLGELNTTVYDANNAKTFGTYYVSGDKLNIPDGHTLLFVIPIGVGRIAQFAFHTFNTSSDKNIYYRRSLDNGSFENTSWYKINMSQ